MWGKLVKWITYSNNQYGFQKGHSTSYALIDLYNKISTALNKKKVAIEIFWDLSKAVDTKTMKFCFHNQNILGFAETHSRG